jgi:hypothetical protein
MERAPVGPRRRGHGRAQKENDEQHVHENTTRKAIASHGARRRTDVRGVSGGAGRSLATRGLTRADGRSGRSDHVGAPAVHHRRSSSAQTTGHVSAPVCAGRARAPGVASSPLTRLPFDPFAIEPGRRRGGAGVRLVRRRSGLVTTGDSGRRSGCLERAPVRDAVRAAHGTRRRGWTRLGRRSCREDGCRSRSDRWGRCRRRSDRRGRSRSPSGLRRRGGWGRGNRCALRRGR